MKKLIHILAYLLIITVLTSCISLLFNPYTFSIKEQEMFEVKSTGLSSQLNINGYFVDENYIDSVWGDQRMIEDNLLFYEDGTFIRFGFKREVLDTLQNMANIKLLQNIDTWNRKSWGAVHGFYSLRNDTIVTKDFEYMQFAWEMRLMEFKIIDKNTIKLIRIKFYDETDIEWDESRITEDNVASMNKYIYHFYPATELPPSEFSFTKQKKWFWKNKKDWKAHKKLVKQKKKELKSQTKNKNILN